MHWTAPVVNHGTIDLAPGAGVLVTDGNTDVAATLTNRAHDRARRRLRRELVNAGEAEAPFEVERTSGTSGGTFTQTRKGASSCARPTPPPRR